MDPKDQKPEINPGNDWEQDLEVLRSTLAGPEPVEPPDLLDQAVLNTARRELSASRRKPMRWIGAFATAAVVVLALAIVVQQDQQTPEFLQDGRIETDSTGPAATEKEAIRQAPSKLESPLITPEPAPVLRKKATPAAEVQILEYEMRENTVGSAAAITSNEADQPVSEAKNQAAKHSEDRRIEESGLINNRARFEDGDGLPSADSWIEYMLELRQAERYQELGVEKKAFREVYPDYPLPSELQD